MRIAVQRVEYRDIEALRDLYRQEARCQIIYDSIVRRGLADPYLILVDGRVGGYGGVWTRYDPGRLMEFYALPAVRAHALAMFRELVSASGAKEMEAQTNMPLMVLMLYDCASNIRAENVLFQDAVTTHWQCPGATFRAARPGDLPADADAPWVVEAGGAVVASGGFLCHYNPPYGDIFMSVAEPARRRGYGSYIVQELKRVCYEAGRTPAARCNGANTASRRTLEKAGLLPCGRLLIGDLGPV